MSQDTLIRRQKILVVDDNEHNRLVAQGHLVAAGYAVILAEGGEQGVREYHEKAPDLVLLDVLMPGVDGFETCKRIKALPGGKDTPVVFLTALSDLGSHQKALESGADDFSVKPINRTELLIRVRSLLWVKRLRDELSEGYDLIRSQRDVLLRVQRQKEELAALVVHDLKGPLTAIYAAIQFVVDSPEISVATREALHDAAIATQAMHRMVMNLLDISRSEDGELIPQFGDVDLSSVLDEVCNTLSGAAHVRTQTLATACDWGRKIVLADRDLLVRLLENLVENSIKYAPTQSTIRIDAQSTTDGALEFRVRDEGPGISHEFRERIFEKYVQLEDDSAAHNRTSRGLGLTFCRLAVEAHGGRIWVEDNQPKGSAFCVSIPASYS